MAGKAWQGLGKLRPQNPTWKGSGGQGGMLSAPAPAPISAPWQGMGGNTSGNAGAWQGTGGGGNFSNPAANIIPAQPPAPSYSMSDSNGTIAQADSTFSDQESAYNEALKKVLANITHRRQALDRDTKQSKAGIEKNRVLGMTGVGEDFAARGLGHSGLFVDARAKAEDAYGRQASSVESAFADGTEELNFNENKERSDTAARVQAAKRDALYRLQMNNNLTGM